LKLDRALQKRLLEACANNYPGYMSRETWNDQFEELDEHVLAANLVYLHQHGLMEKSVSIGHQNDYTFSLGGLCCTEAGMDFLADDGGLSAILGTLTIKLHEDTLQKLIAGKILESDLPDEEKGRLVEGVKELSGEATKHLTMKLIDEGLAHLPRAIEIVGSFLR